MGDPAKDYVESQFRGPKVVKQFDAPSCGLLQCCECGKQVSYPEDAVYEDLAACPNDNCMGQMFCAKWEGWRVPTVLELAKEIVKKYDNWVELFGNIPNCSDNKRPNNVFIPVILLKQLKISIE